MTSFLTLIRRTSAVLGTIAALMVTGSATAQKVQLSTGPSCDFSSMSVTPNGTVNVNCTGSSTVTYSVTAPSSLPQNTSTVSQVKMNRTGATAAAVDVNFTLSGPCTAPGGLSVNIGASASSSNLVLDIGAGPGTCVVTPTPTDPPGAASGGPVSIAVVDPNADVTFAFATATSNASVGSGAISIRINRGGGTNGTFTVPLTLSGSLAPGGSAVAGNLSAASLTFTPSDSFKNVSYTPPPVTPATPALPAQLVISFGAITGGTPPQTGSGTGSHTLTLDGPGVGCPAPVAVGSLGSANTPFLLALPNGNIKSYNLPTPTLGKSSGTFKLSSTSSSNPVAPWYYEVHINKCPGLVQAPATGVKDTCYGSYANATAVFSKFWFTKEVGIYTKAQIISHGYCWAPDTEGPWYVNIRYNYAGCTTGICGWSAQWTNFTY